MKEKHKITEAWLNEGTGELWFLKRRHMVVDGGRLAIQPHAKHCSALAEMAGITGTLRPRKTPLPAKLPQENELLGEKDAGMYRWLSVSLQFACVRST